MVTHPRPSFEHNADRSGSFALTTLLAGEQRPTILLRKPVILEILSRVGTARFERNYDRVDTSSDGQWIGLAEVDVTGARFRVVDRWTARSEDKWQLDRSLEILAAEDIEGVRLLLELEPAMANAGFAEFRFFAPGAMYDLNDLDGDGFDDYVDSQVLLYREDRLSAMSVLGYHEPTGLTLTLSRADVPDFDPTPDRKPGQTVVVQRTDIGALGVMPSIDGRAVMVAAYPFVERDRSHALNVTTRPGWGAFWPGSLGEAFTCSYLVGAYKEVGPHEALWRLWRCRLDQLQPAPVELTSSLENITHYRIDALLAYYKEDGEVAGFVTNCHPQDGRQLSNVVQYGFTGQNVLNAYGLLRAASPGDDAEERRIKALKVIDSFVADALCNVNGLGHGLYNMESHSYGSWWTGLLLPLAYAKPGDELQRLMGPVYDHLRPVIDALRGRNGVYLRCLAEEYDALLQAYELERANGALHDDWLRAAGAFAQFLLASQQGDGSWYRAYDLTGDPLIDPDYWFGQTDVQRKSSTATVVPLLLRLHQITGDAALVQACENACGYVNRAFVEGLKFNGGIHDSMYAKPQLVDHESIIFAFRALLETYEATGEDRYLAQATRAAWIVCSWAWLWDVPLPRESTLARFGFRTTGWTGCDTPGAGYIHPMGVIAVPDLVRMAQLTGDDGFVRTAELILPACNENVALPGNTWGYARPGLQEEGLTISWCWADDPMFTDTEFGGRLKGEGNKTCLPWISAVTIWAYQEMLARYGTTDVRVASQQSAQTL